MHRTPLARRTQIINCLVEGNSIRSTERMTNTHRDTIMRLLVEVGDGCAKIMDERMRGLPCMRVQVDEILELRGEEAALDYASARPYPRRRHVDVRRDQSRYEASPDLS